MTARTSSLPRPRFGLVAWGLVVISAGASAPPTQDGSPGGEVAELRDGRRLTGRLIAPDGGPIAFEPGTGGDPIPVERLLEVRPDADRPGGAAGKPVEAPPFLLSTGLDRRLSGRLVSIDGEAVRLAIGPDGREVSADRRGVSSLVQRPGEARVAAESFEGDLDAERWSIRTGVEAAPSPGDEGRALTISPDEAEARYRLPEPIEAGRVELSFTWGGRELAGRRWSVDLVFDGPLGEEITRVVLGWADPFPSVESRGGPEIVVQPLVLEPGWHRLSARFGPDRTLLAIDGDQLGRGAGPRGALIALRFRSEPARDAEPANGLQGRVDDLLAVRSFEPTSGFEVEPGQDELRLVSGDQVWGEVVSADEDRVRLLVLDRELDFSWSEVAGLYFRREPFPSGPVDGPIARAEWEVGDPDSRPDRVEGAIVGLDDGEIRLAVPYLGTIPVPRDRFRRLEILGRARQVVLDPHARHLGDQLMPELDPPLPDGDRYEIPFTLDTLPDRPAALVIDAVQVEGDYDGGRFVEDLRNGFLKTTLALNGEEFDDLNRHVEDANRSPSRLRIPVPPGLLSEGENVLAFRQLGREKEKEYRDDLGLLRVALEWTEEAPESP
ncbi:hypothetical protein [Tautonia plasticadhaerens]|uniref:Uncharacterized protein n=1 Tax=Tautonia plasticadhaerens TaxID=2527974 RepID=A0A518HAH6_9BACT|nr:hypothetical protein [Tautonia plasticadhaerens]QDV37851.1 hypothetical protein ElP_57980 [Tautonia plasticadhaerens]